MYLDDLDLCLDLDLDLALSSSSLPTLSARDFTLVVRLFNILNMSLSRLWLCEFPFSRCFPFVSFEDLDDFFFDPGSVECELALDLDLDRDRDSDFITTSRLFFGEELAVSMVHQHFMGGQVIIRHTQQ